MGISTIPLRVEEQRISHQFSWQRLISTFSFVLPDPLEFDVRYDQNEF